MQKVMVIGAGYMGAGIAQVCAQAGNHVFLVDNDERALETARGNISQSMEKLFSKGLLSEHPPTILKRIRSSQSYREVADGMQWIIEAVIEDELIKRDLFSDLDRLTDAQVALATNTSSIPISRLAADLRHPDRVLGLHFFGPVPLMPLVEVIRSKFTNKAIFESGVAFVRSIGKRPIGVQKDIPGFVMNRVFAAAFRESLELVSSGTATVEDIDAGMRLGFGWNVGPFEIADNAGIDTFLRVGRSFKALGESHLVADTDILENMVAQGRLGKKAGRGFYDYSHDSGKKKT